MKAKLVGGLLLAPALMFSASTVMAASHGMGEPDCTIEISRTEIGFIVTVGGGSGMLNCDGKMHKFRVGGLKVGAMGASGSDAVGEVYGLKNLADFSGTYSETKAQATVIKGQSVMDLANSNGVRIRLHGKSKGFDAQLAGGGLKLTLE